MMRKSGWKQHLPQTGRFNSSDTSDWSAIGNEEHKTTKRSFLIPVDATHKEMEHLVDLMIAVA